MKKLFRIMPAVPVLVLTAVFFAVPVFADTGIPPASLRQAADSLDISHDLDGSAADISALHGEGVRLFDTGRLLAAGDADRIEEILDDVSDRTGFDVTVVTTDGFSGYKDSRAYADNLYIKSGFGAGQDGTGTLLVINMTDRDVYLYTRGEAIDYIPDRQQNYIYDELDGGLISRLGSGDYAGAMAVYAAGIQDGFENGKTSTGRKKGFSIFNVLISAVVSAAAAILPVNGVKRKYAMQSEKRQAQGFNLAYRANSNMMLAAGPSAARLLSRDVTRAPIPVPVNNGGRGSGHGGGKSTVHTSVGGGVHGGSGRKF